MSKRTFTFTKTLTIASLAWSAHAVAQNPPAPADSLEPVVVRATALFDFDQDVVKPEDRAKILAQLGAAGAVTWQSVNAVGYTDGVGTPAYNQGLSERRAAAIKNYLVSKGVSADMVATTGKGAADPVADNDSADGRAQNRRTAIEFSGVRTTAQR